MDYGEGYYIEGQNRRQGRIIVDENRLYLSGGRDYSSTYVPLEKIERLKYIRGGLEIRAKFSAANIVRVVISLPTKNIKWLVKDLVEKLHLKKKFLRREWCGEIAWR